jgi:hypothetical protein
VRYEDLEVGERYILKRSRSRPVTMEKTPDDVRERGMVRVRFEDGIQRGEVSDQQLRFLRPADPFPIPPGGDVPVEPEPPQPRRLEVVKEGRWPPEPGDLVHWPEKTGELEWTVVSVDLKTGKTVVAGEVFSTWQEITAHLGKLEPVDRVTHIDVQPERWEWHEYEVQRAEFFGEETEGDEANDAEPDTRTPVERVVDRLEFSEQCLRQYRRDYEPRIPWSKVSDRLRRELRNRGAIIRRDPKEYLRIRTRRFDVVVNEPPSDNAPPLIHELQMLPSWRKRKAKKAA